MTLPQIADLRKIRDEAQTDDPPTYAHQAERAELRAMLEHMKNQLRVCDEALSNARGRATAHAQELVAFKKHATEVLHREADEREFCKDFDDVMEQIGLPRRKHEAEVNLTVTLTVTVNTAVSTEAAAEHEIDRDTIIQAIQSGNGPVEIDEFTVDYVNWES